LITSIISTVLIIGIIAIVVLVVFDKINEKLYPYIVFGIALSLLWSVTLVSPYLIGTDIHVEYYFTQKAIFEGWDSLSPYTASSSMPLVVLVPLWVKLTGIQAILVFKVLFPMALAGVAVVLYYVYKQWLEAKDAFIAVFFFVVMPVFFMETSGIAKQEFAELFFVICLALAMGKGKVRLGFAIMAGVVVIISHYTMAILLIGFLVGYLVVMLAMRWLKAKPSISFWQLGTLIVVLSTFAFLYFSQVSSGAVMHILAYQAGCVLPFDTSFLTVLTPKGSAETCLVLPVVTDGGQSSIAQAGLGLDFMRASMLGKVFRILQYATEILIVIGAGYMILKWRKLNIPLPYLALAIVSVLVLGVCIIFPGAAALLNISRIYHISLFFLAPALVVGGKLLFRNVKVVALCLLIPYFIFTSGLVYEVAGSAGIANADIPSSVALSNHRIDLGGSLTHDDEVARDWVVGNAKSPVYADWYGMLFVIERAGIEGVYQIPEDISDVPSGSYIFLRTRNNRDEGIVQWVDVGARQICSYQDIGFSELGYEIEYQCGDAMILRRI